MNIHEYQAREILRAHGVPVPPGEIATTPEEAERIAARYGGMVVVKAQVHAGGRGKAGGVKLAVDPADAREKAEAILGLEIKGLTVEKVLVAPAEDIETEAYLGIVNFASRVFSEEVPLATLEDARDVFKPGGPDVGDRRCREDESRALQAKVDDQVGRRARRRGRC